MRNLNMSKYDYISTKCTGYFSKDWYDQKNKTVASIASVAVFAACTSGSYEVAVIVVATKEMFARSRYEEPLPTSIAYVDAFARTSNPLSSGERPSGGYKYSICVSFSKNHSVGASSKPNDASR